MRPRFTCRQCLSVLAVILFSTAFFLFLYFFDNKYTQTDTQPVNGLLVLSEKDIESAPQRFLCRGWAFYPDVLLTPDTYAREASSLYMNYIDIGEYSHFDLFGRRRLPHGCGTYVMQIHLPKGPQTYALSLPEIFSSYRLYVNDSLLLQIGNPDSEHYQARTRHRMATFEAEGMVTILLAVSDYSHFYSGLIYSPAFGTPLALNLGRGIRLGINLAAAVLAVTAIVLALYAGKQRRQANAFLYALLCLTMCFSSTYLLYHSLFELPVFPWYGLELCGKYLVTLLVLVLHNRICHRGRIPALASNTTAALFCIISLIYGLSSTYLTVPVMQMFTASEDIFKVLTAGYLIITAYRALDTLNRSTSFLFYASVFYAESALWDLFLPGYEPVYGGWFPEWGGLAMVLAAGITLWSEIFQAYTYNLAFAEEHRQVTRQLAMQIAYSRQINDQALENRRLIHDFRQHLRTLTGIARENGDQQVLDYLGQVSQITEDAASPLLPSFCSNMALDAILRYYYNHALARHIAMDIHISLPDSLPLTDVELCTVLGNLLENAVEACERQVCGNPAIYLASRENTHAWFLLVENSYNGHIKMKNGRFLSHKSSKPRPGIGLESARKIIENRGGTLDIYPMTEKFRVGICIPANSE